MSCPPAAGAPPGVVSGSHVHCDESKARLVPFSAWRAAFEELRKGRVDQLVHIPERSRLWRIAKHLDSVQLHQLDEDLSWEPDALVGAPEERSGRLFLGAYSEAGLVYALQQYGLWERVVDVARNEPMLRIEGTGESIQRFTITDGDGGATLVDVKAGLRYGPDGDDERAHDLPGPASRPWLSMEWLTLQNPYRTFAHERPQLPGQRHPGFGAGREVMELMLISGWRLGCLGVVAHPAWFHNAVMYRIHYRFVDPAEEGRFLALMHAWRDSGTSLAQASRDVEGGLVLDGEGQVVEWRPGPIIAALDSEAELESQPGWLDAVDASRAEASYAFPSSSRHRP